MKRNWIIISLTALLVLIVAYLVVHLHSVSRREVVSRFQDIQLLYAHHFAEQIESFFWGHTRGLLALPSFVSSHANGTDRLKAEIDAYSREMQNNHIREIFFCDEAGRVIYSTDRNGVGLNRGQTDFFTWAREKGKKGEVFVSPLPASGNSLLFHLSIPLYRRSDGPKHSQESEKFAGFISLTLDLKEFLTHELKEEGVGLHQMWIIDQQGNLLFHSEHPEMTMRNIRQREGSCNPCHISFDYTERILKEKKGTVDYALRNSPKKQAAFGTVQFGNVSWAVVVNFPYDEATAFAKKSLWEQLILLGLVILAFAISFTLILRNSGLKTQAEAIHLQEKMAERKKAEEALLDLEKHRRNLSFQLLTAQETERRRISRELHDEFGGALAVFKLRLGYIEKHLREDQAEIKKACESTLQYIDQVIENVHRLSRDLSPSILEDLGLSSALRWLVNSFGKNYNIVGIISEVTDIDHLFPQNTQIVIYRIVQEALTNIGKHAQAKNVSLVVKRDDSMISISLEDDGKGFDVKGAMIKDVGERGIGLASMDERSRMLGGSLEVWSERGHGTRVTLRIPTGKKESA
jgi:signal transduction histidine kinase